MLYVKNNMSLLEPNHDKIALSSSREKGLFKYGLLSGNHKRKFNKCNYIRLRKKMTSLSKILAKFLPYELNSLTYID